MSVQRIIYPQFEILNDFVFILFTIIMSTFNFRMERILDYEYNKVALVKIIFTLTKQSQKKSKKITDFLTTPLKSDTLFQCNCVRRSLACLAYQTRI